MVSRELKKKNLKMDIQVATVVKCNTIPIEYWSQLREPMSRKEDNLLKKPWEAASNIMKTNTVATSALLYAKPKRSAEEGGGRISKLADGLCFCFSSIPINTSSPQKNPQRTTVLLKVPFWPSIAEDGSGLSSHSAYIRGLFYTPMWKNYGSHLGFWERYPKN